MRAGRRFARCEGMRVVEEGRACRAEMCSDVKVCAWWRGAWRRCAAMRRYAYSEGEGVCAVGCVAMRRYAYMAGEGVYAREGVCSGAKVCV